MSTCSNDVAATESLYCGHPWASHLIGEVSSFQEYPYKESTCRASCMYGLMYYTCNPLCLCLYTGISIYTHYHICRKQIGHCHYEG